MHILPKSARKEHLTESLSFSTVELQICEVDTNLYCGPNIKNVQFAQEPLTESLLMAYCCTPHSGPNLKRNKNAYFAQERPKGAFNKNPIVFNELQKIDFSLAQKQTRFHLAPPNSFALQAKFMFSRKTTKFEKNIHRRIDVM